ncbi:hypothetical protein PMNALOAF_1816 [Methylobacterium adhaesivum]|jgi:hypothetical protein|nr:hypothetical protein PMNALOAF_1816 [Methylobacterium adhaesivum]
MIRSATLIAFTSAMMQASPAQASEATELLGLWEQVATNAGACETCTIDFRAAGSGLSVTANNGWAATLSSSGEPDTFGAGRWENRGAAWVSGKAFSVRFHRVGNRLEMTMTIDTGSEPKPVVRGVYKRTWQGM